MVRFAGKDEPLPAAVHPRPRPRARHARRAPGTWGFATLVLLLGCSSDPGVFECTASDQCGGGTCQPLGYCSFPNPRCASGQEYGALAGGLAYTCVPSSFVDDDVENESDGASAPDEPSDSDSDSDADGSTSSAPIATSDPVGGGADSTTGAYDPTSGTSSGEGSSTGTTDGSISTSAFLDETGRGEGGFEDAGFDEGGSSETGDPVVPPPCSFHDPFDGQGTAFLPFWAVVGDFPDRAYLSGTGQLEFNVHTQRVGSTVMVGAVSPTSPSYAAIVELENVDMSPAGFEQFVFGFGVLEQTPSGPRQKYLEFQVSRGDLSARTLDGTWTHHRTSVFDDDAHRYLRLRVDLREASPLYAWETSADGVAWNLFQCLSPARAGCIWPGAGFPADGRFDTSLAEVRFIVGAYDVSAPPHPNAFSLESFSFCALSD